jgi:hypothetical protein
MTLVFTLLPTDLTHICCQPRKPGRLLKLKAPGEESPILQLERCKMEGWAQVSWTPLAM